MIQDVDVRSYLKKNIIDMDKLWHHLDTNSLFYQLGESKELIQNMIFLIKKAVLCKIVSPLLATGIIYIATPATKATLLIFGIPIDCCQTWKYLIAAFEKLHGNINIKFSCNIKFTAESGAVCDEYEEPGFGSNSDLPNTIEYESDTIETRMQGGIAIIRVGGTSDVQVKEEQDCNIDSLNSVRGAIKNDIIPGGISLLDDPLLRHNIINKHFTKEWESDFIDRARATCNNGGDIASVIVGNLFGNI